jgi:hypothetical protein
VKGHDFTACGKSLLERRFVTGHDFSRAGKLQNERPALAAANASVDAYFFRRLFSRAAKGYKTWGFSP